MFAHLRSLEKICLPVSQTGIAASLHDGGQTLTTRFGLPLDLKENSVSSINPASEKANLIRHCDLIMCDEATMAHKYAFHCIDRLLRDLTGKSNRVFGGKIFVLCGDFRQTLPVVKRGSNVDIIQACIKRSPLWAFFSVRYLKIINSLYFSFKKFN